MQKVEALRKLSVSFDEKISPLLNPEQQQKFQELRQQLRRRMLRGGRRQGGAEGFGVVRRRAQVAMRKRDGRSWCSPLTGMRVYGVLAARLLAVIGP